MDRPGDVELAAPIDALVGGGSSSDGDVCTGDVELRDPQDADVPRLMPEWLPAGQQVGAAWARAEITSKRSCPAVPTALVGVRRDSTGAIDGSVRLLGPSPVPYGRYDGPTYEDFTVRNDLHGTLVRIPAVDAILQLQWADPDGWVWSLTGYGLDLESLRAAAAGLVLQTNGSTPVASLPSAPPGLEVIWQLQELPGAPAAEEPYWHVVNDDGETLSIVVYRPLVPTPAVGSVVYSNAPEFLDVRGRLALGYTATADGQSSLTWNEEPDLVVRVSGTFDLPTLQRIAESLAPADSDDPRIKPI